MNKSIFTILFSILILSSCSSDSADLADSSSALPNVTLISRNNDMEVVQIDISNNADDMLSTNLTDQIGLPINYNELSLRDDVLAFFDQNAQNYSVYEKNLSTGSIAVTESICDPVDQRGISANRSNNKLVLTTRDENTSINKVYILDKSTNECLQVEIGVGDVSPFIKSTIVDNEKLYVYLTKESGLISIIQMDLNTGNVINELILENQSQVRIVDELIVTKFSNGVLDVYDKNTFEFVRSFQTNLTFGDIGLGHTDNDGGNVRADYLLPQPSFVSISPAIINISTSEITEGSSNFIFDLRDNLIAEIEANVTLDNITVDVQSGSVILTYLNFNTGETNLLFSNFNAEILKTVPLDNLPNKILVR